MATGDGAYTAEVRYIPVTEVDGGIQKMGVREKEKHRKFNDGGGNWMTEN